VVLDTLCSFLSFPSGLHVCLEEVVDEILWVGGWGGGAFLTFEKIRNTPI